MTKNGQKTAKNITKLWKTNQKNSETNQKTMQNDVSASQNTSQKGEYASQKGETASQKGEFASQKKLSASQKNIIELVSSNSKITTNEMATHLGIDRRNVQEHIKKLQELGLLRREGGRKNGHWVVVQEDM